MDLVMTWSVVSRVGDGCGACDWHQPMLRLRMRAYGYAIMFGSLTPGILCLCCIRAYESYGSTVMTPLIEGGADIKVTLENSKRERSLGLVMCVMGR